jgi:hypothetical protein
MDFSKAIQTYAASLNGKPLTRWIAEQERQLGGDFAVRSSEALNSLAAAFAIKRSVSEVNTFIHAVGILACLPHILEPDEQIASLSLGAGNTGKDFDLETDRRVAEFKFITWKGRDAVRQDSIFADIIKLCLHASPKRKLLYLTGADLARKFLLGGRAITSVLSRRPMLQTAFVEQFGSNYVKVCDFIRCDRNTVEVVDLNCVVPGLREAIAGR